MQSIKKTTRNGLAIAAISLAAFGLSACGAGHISQTADQVAAVDGASADSYDNEVALRDVTVHLTADGSQAAVKFTAVNQDPANVEHTLQSVRVGDTPVQFDGNTRIAPQGSLVSDLESELELIPHAGSDMHITYVPNSFSNNGLAFGGNQMVTFVFDFGEVEVPATVSEPQPVSGTLTRENGSDEHSH